jgi:hypothetical protein
MITRPTTAQLIDVVRRELAERVAPAVTDPQVTISLQMIDHILRTLAVRADHEAGWMVEEMAAIEALGEQVAGSGLPGAAAVTEALDAFRSGRSAGRSTAEITDDYNAATEVLSRCVEATFAAGGELWEAVAGLLDERLAHETEVIGPDFQLVGRQ